MRIISDQHDYYDSVQRSGQDRSLVYVRKPQEIRVPWKKWPFPQFYDWYTNICQYTIGFCGKIYPMLHLSSGAYGDNCSRQCYNIDEVDALMAGKLSAHDNRVYLGEAKNRRTKWGWRRHSMTRKDYVKLFEEYRVKQDAFADMFTPVPNHMGSSRVGHSARLSAENEIHPQKISPIFVAWIRSHNEGIITYNAKLKPHEFFRIFEPYAAFQEISMFMASQAMPEKTMPVIPDVLKAESKGFNEWSFRTPPASGK